MVVEKCDDPGLFPLSTSQEADTRQEFYDHYHWYYYYEKKYAIRVRK